MPVTLPVGTIVRSRYQIERLLGTARAGGIYLVKDLNSKQKRFAFFVLKELTEPNRQARHHFTLSAVSLTKLEHPVLPHILRTFSDDDYERVYIVTSYVEGTALETLRLLEPNKRFSLDQAIAYMLPILDAVSYLHRQDMPVMHQNISPAAILVSATTGQPMLVNLGLPGECGQGMRPGFDQLSAYEAPELYSSGPDARTDIYALGATLYALLTGVLPSDAFYRSALMENNEHDPLVPLSELVQSVPLPVVSVVHKALTIDRQERYATVEQFVKALKAALAKKPVSLPGVLAARSLATAVDAPQVEETMRKLPPARSERVAVPAPALRRSSTLRTRSGLLLLVTLVLLIGGSLAVYMLIQHNAHTSLASSSPTVDLHAVTRTTVSSPTTTLNGYPRISGAYAGTIIDMDGTTRTNLFLTTVRQDQGKLHGDFSDLQVSGPFEGTVDRAGNLQLTVTNEAGRTVLFLEGGMQSPTSLSGDYYPCGNTGGGPCQRMAGGGVWNVLFAG